MPRNLIDNIVKIAYNIVVEVSMKRFIIAFVVFLCIDLLWLVKVAPNFYKSHLGHLMADKVDFIPAIIFYIMYIIVLLLFVINPAVDKESLSKALYLGAILGFAMYGTYDLTNMATLKDWPLIVTVIDLLWGTFITGTTSFISTYIIMKINW